MVVKPLKSPFTDKKESIFGEKSIFKLGEKKAAAASPTVMGRPPSRKTQSNDTHPHPMMRKKLDRFSKQKKFPKFCKMSLKNIV